MPHAAKQFEPFELQFHTVLATAFVHLHPSQIHGSEASQLQEPPRFLSSSAEAIDKICAQIFLICTLQLCHENIFKRTSMLEWIFHTTVQKSIQP